MIKKIILLFLIVTAGIYADEFVRTGGSLEMKKCGRKSHWECTEIKDGSIVKIRDFEGDKERKFVTDGKNIYYQNENNDSGSVKYYSVFETADAKTFSIINDSLVKDKNHVYYITRRENITLKDADPKTFEYIGESYPLVYAKDKKKVYVIEKFGNPVYVIKNADPATFELLKENYSRDKNSAYFQEKPAKGIDAKTFEVLGYFHVKDKNNIYMREQYDYEPVKGADIKTFEILTPLYTKDKNHVYYNSEIIEGADSLTFMLMKRIKENEYDYAEDKNRVYYKGEEILKSDPLTFEIINSNFAKDKNNVYYKSSSRVVITGINENKASNEKNNVEMSEITVSDEVMKQIYTGEKPYYEIKELSKPSFGNISEKVKASYCEPEKSNTCKKLENADPVTFEINYEIKQIIPASIYSSSGIPRIAVSYMSKDSRNYYIDSCRINENQWKELKNKYTSLSKK